MQEQTCGNRRKKETPLLCFVYYGSSSGGSCTLVGRTINLHLFDEETYAVAGVTFLVQVVDEGECLSIETSQDLAGVGETARLFHVFQSVPLYLVVVGLLFEDVDEDEVGGVGADAVDDREGEFAFG